MAEPPVIQHIRASSVFSLETWELRHWHGNKILFLSATKEITVFCSYLYWTRFTLLWLHQLNSNYTCVRNTEAKPHRFYLSGWRNRISEMPKFYATFELSEFGRLFNYQSNQEQGWDHPSRHWEIEYLNLTVKHFMGFITIPGHLVRSRSCITRCHTNTVLGYSRNFLLGIFLFSRKFSIALCHAWRNFLV